MVVEGLLETITIEVIIPGHTNILITYLYRTIGSNIHNFVDCLEQLFCGLSVLKTIFICGVFNTNILKHDSDHGVNLFLDTMYSMGLYPLIDRPSRITNHSFTLIDNIFTNSSDYDNTSGLLIPDVSDHLPVFVICKYPNLNRKTKNQLVKKRLVNSDTLDSLNDKLLNANCETVLKGR